MVLNIAIIISLCFEKFTSCSLRYVKVFGGFCCFVVLVCGLFVCFSFNIDVN